MLHSSKIVSTQLPPCAISKHNDSFILGTYELHKDSGKRTGSLNTYNEDLELISSSPTASAVLDTKIQGDKLFMANSTGQVIIYDINDGLKELRSIQIGEVSDLVTQISVKDTQLSSVLTNGELVVYDLQQDSEVYRNKNHDLEAWTVEYALPDSNAESSILFTGGDDRALTCTDLRIPYMLWKVKPHDAGVTSLLPKSSTSLWTGGYDDCLNFIDLRTRRVNESQNLGGGVWRLIPNQSNSKILACCMYGGLRVLDPTSAEVLGSLENHESMVYGGAWLDEDNGITCSFYDKMLQKWSIQI